MASQSKLQSATTPSSLSSRLSPHAQPFIFSHRQQALVGVSASSVNDSLSDLDKNCYSSEVGLALAEQNDGAVTSSMDDDQSFLRKENLAVEGSQLSGKAISSLSRHLTNVNAAQVACHNHPNQLKLNLKGAEEGNPVNDSSAIAGKDKIDSEDIDEDSPCWKGKNFNNSPFIVSETLDPELTKSKPESSSVLNPKAPQFLPRAIERRSSAPVGEPGAYVSMSFQEMLPPISPPLFSNQASQESTAVLNSDNMGGIDDSLIGANMAMHGDGDCSILIENPLELSKSLSTPLGVESDAVILVDTIHALSELLLGNCSGSFFFKELQLEKIKCTISNLSLLSKDMDGQSSSIHGSNVEFIQSYQTKSPPSSKFPGTELQPPRSKVVISRPPPPPEVRKYELQPARTKVVISPPPEVNNMRKYELQKMDSSVIMQDFKSFSSDIGNEIAQATMKSSSSGYETEQQISPQALLYKDLWLQATQELHFIKKKAWRNTEKYS